MRIFGFLTIFSSLLLTVLSSFFGLNLPTFMKGLIDAQVLFASGAQCRSLPDSLWLRHVQRRQCYL